jgi:prephenate dehydrogenase
MKGRVFVIGLGLIGGSIALCIKKEHKDAFIIGYDIHPEQARLGKMLGVIDEVADHIVEGAASADLIIISAPVIETEAIIHLLSEQSLNPEVIITDTGSTKSKIVANAASLKKK